MAKITTMTQKRRAPTQAGPPKTKKVILDKQNKPSAAPAKESKKRSVPITKPIAPVDDSDSDGPDGDDDVGLEEEEQQDGEADAAMEVDSKPPKDPNGPPLHVLSYLLEVLIRSFQPAANRIKSKKTCTTSAALLNGTLSFSSKQSASGRLRGRRISLCRSGGSTSRRSWM